MKLIYFVLIVIFAAFTYFVVKLTNEQLNDIRSRAAGENILEAESSAISGNALTHDDSTASGGKYIQFSSGNPTVVPSQSATSTPIPTGGSSSVIVGAGDIQCPTGPGSGWSSCRADVTAQVISSINPTAVLPLGDTQYDTGEYTNFQTYYKVNWGQFNTKTYPVIGNHEWGTPNGSGYFDYFEKDAGFGSGSTSKRPGERGKGWYSYNLGSWHLIALNSNLTSSPEQMSWLRQDLTANADKKCTLVYLHHPFFTSDTRSGRTMTDTKAKLGSLFQLLYDNNVDIWLNGHDHHYQRFKPSNINGQVDTTRGITEFTVGTGGDNHYWNSDFVPTANSAANDHTTFGVIKLTLLPTGYTFEFVPAIIAGAPTPFRDSGSASCH